MEREPWDVMTSNAIDVLSECLPETWPSPLGGACPSSLAPRSSFNLWAAVPKILCARESHVAHFSIPYCIYPAPIIPAATLGRFITISSGVGEASQSRATNPHLTNLLWGWGRRNTRFTSEQGSSAAATQITVDCRWQYQAPIGTWMACYPIMTFWGCLVRHGRTLRHQEPSKREIRQIKVHRPRNTGAHHVVETR